MYQLPDIDALAAGQPESRRRVNLASFSPLYHIAKTYHDVTAVFEQFMGISRARWTTLRLLSRRDSLSQTALTQELQIDAAAVTRQVKQLESEGLVTRWAAPEDNRYTMVALTDAGRSYVEAKLPRRDQFDAIVLEGLAPEEIENLLRCLAHIRRNVENVPLDGDAAA